MSKQLLPTRQLAPGLGVEVTINDLRTMSPAEVAEFERLWREHHVMLIRGQNLSADEQIAFVSRFGPVGEVASTSPDMTKTQRQVMIIANTEFEGKNGSLPDGEMWFHFDQAYLEVPIAAGFLYGVEVPRTGGYTLFSNATQAYRLLPEDLKLRLNGLVAENVYDYRATTKILADGEEATGHVHPVVRRHPVTGVPALFVSRLMTRRILGVSEQENRELLDELFERLEHQDAMYEHHWHPGDLLVWDNCTVMHARTNFDPKETRILRRLSLAGQGIPEAYTLASA